MINGSEEVKPAHEGCRHVNIESQRFALLISSPNWVGGGKDAGPGIEGGFHPRFGHRDRLLLHRLVDRGPVLGETT